MQSHHKVLTTEKFQNYEALKGGCILSKNKFNLKNNKSRWLASDISFKLLHTGCPIAHGNTSMYVISCKHKFLCFL